MRRLWIILAIGLVLPGTTAFAWNDFGHMTVAAIAFEHLDPPVRTKIAVLLRSNPLYKTWTKGIAAKDRDRTAFMMAATWPDIIKSDSTFTNDTDKSAPVASRNVGYKDKLQHRYWHFIDMPFSPDGTALKNPVPPNAQERIGVLRATLSKKSGSKNVKSYDLVWLLHLVGDVHQPLHATSRFDHDQPDGDQGGNLVALCTSSVCDKKDRLHFHWDDLVGPQHPTIAEVTQKAAQIAPADPQLAKISDEGTWIDESFKEATKDVYAAPIGVGAGPFTLDAKYDDRAHAVAEDRVALAGARLASLLNEALK